MKKNYLIHSKLKKYATKISSQFLIKSGKNKEEYRNQILKIYRTGTVIMLFQLLLLNLNINNLKNLVETFQYK